MSDVIIKSPKFKPYGPSDHHGIYCGSCANSIAPVKWPDEEKVFSCGLHKISLQKCLRETGFSSASWVCKDFEQTSRAPADNVATFKAQVAPMMEERVLYENDGRFYRGEPFESLPGKFPEEFKNKD